MTKNRTKDDGLTGAVVVKGDDQLAFACDVAIDIETAPIPSPDEDVSLLDPTRSRVAAIGYLDPSKMRYIISYDPDEAAMLRQFWRVYLTAHSAGFRLVGFNILGFDMPFLIKRSWAHGIAVPKSVLASSGRYWSETLIDLMILWRCGAWKEFISLDALARFLGAGEKIGNGEQFYRLWTSNRQAAIDYLMNDVRITLACALKMGVIAQSA